MSANARIVARLGWEIIKVSLTFCCVLRIKTVDFSEKKNDCCIWSTLEYQRIRCANEQVFAACCVVGTAEFSIPPFGLFRTKCIFFRGYL